MRSCQQTRTQDVVTSANYACHDLQQLLRVHRLESFMPSSRISYLSKFTSKFKKRVDKDTEILIPPVPRLLKSNYPPTDDGRQKIHAALPIAREQAAELHAHLDASSNHLFTNTNASYPSFVPSQATFCTLIFIACLPDVEHEPWYPQNEPFRPQKWHTIPSFRLSQVCRSWRDISIHTPKLWTILCKIVLDSDATKKGRKSYLNFIKELVRRSGDLDL
ncbi:hypothetical protein CPB84DRAFT_243226 [Gymnopilus junonius]|uniref:F-box domain-containing protein n=1 Tax=Gymnopilus junonius TaxID=109634 RepID=A0A9P5TS21_GYMJU|nr:hypothetical protein CPB84DRAFT_243226 [Gymnopilus junonius]